MPFHPPATSCRAGAVVELLCANNTTIPVTISFTVRTEGDAPIYIIKVLVNKADI